ncbi:hypothetical protein [Halomicronema sp. CCY15110]|uniref:hypothetical protein n=1 Tax=Halomicronema sp. CCY15110 TaxID=2767773 RepID=UPI00194E78E4|nr:hypothetical protein [Halomicronema sp. CCY15110]
MQLGPQTLAQALTYYHEQLAHAWCGLPNPADRHTLAHLLLCRLVLIYDLQVGGFLAGGDRWYLHNQLGSQTPDSETSFFQSFFQPLCHQGLSLPAAERPKAVSQKMGDVPYLGCRLFAPQPLEQQQPQLDMPDEVIEKVLGWLAEQVWQRELPPAHARAASTNEDITRTGLAAAWEAMLAVPGEKANGTSTEQLAAMAEKTVDAHLWQALAPQSAGPAAGLTELLATLTADRCHQLIATVLPNLSMLDPACGSGRFLLMTLARLQAVYQICWDYAQTSSHPELQTWVRSLRALDCPPQWAWTRQILTQTLYGVDVRPEAIAVTQTQLWLWLLSTIPAGKSLPLLPDLDFNIVRGNALVGFMRVDEESFDQIAPKRSPAEADHETVLQGNLLQPLAAASYRDTLAEKQIRIEHYRAQTQAMGAEGGIPDYVQREFLRDRIETVNTAAQQKLNDLLFATWSRQLGIVVKEPQPSGRARKRLLTPADVAALHPLHWGFAFNAVMAQGGFDLVITQAPAGTLSPRPEAFYYQHQALFEQAAITLAMFRRSRRQILQQQPELTTLWGTYAGRINSLRDFVRRSPDYPDSGGANTRRSLPFKRLFAQRCAWLAKADGIPPQIL